MPDKNVLQAYQVKTYKLSNNFIKSWDNKA